MIYCHLYNEQIIFKISENHHRKLRSHVHTRASGAQGPVSLSLMTSQFKYIVTHTQKHETVKCIFCGVWVQNFVWNFKGALWNFIQNFKPILRKIGILRWGKNLTTYDILGLWHPKTGSRATISVMEFDGNAQMAWFCVLVVWFWMDWP